MNIVLVYENYKFLLNEECLEVPTANATCAVQEAYNRWIQSNNKAHCYLLAAMFDVLRSKHEYMEWTTFEKIESL